MRNSEGQSVKSDLGHKGPQLGEGAGSGHGNGLPTAPAPSVRLTPGDTGCQWRLL